MYVMGKSVCRVRPDGSHEYIPDHDTRMNLRDFVRAYIIMCRSLFWRYPNR